MATQIVKVLGAESTVSQATAVTALNVLIAAEQVLAAAGGETYALDIAGYAATASVAVGPLNSFACSCVVKYVRP